MLELKVYTSPGAINTYFDTIEEILSRNDLLNKPRKFFNNDETGMPLDPKMMKVIAEKGMKTNRIFLGQ